MGVAKPCSGSLESNVDAALLTQERYRVAKPDGFGREVMSLTWGWAIGEVGENLIWIVDQAELARRLNYLEEQGFRRHDWQAPHNGRLDHRQ